MNTETLFCPACNHKLRVPEDLLGRAVECPECGKTFTAPPPRSAPADARYGEERPRQDAAPDLTDAQDWPQTRQVRDWTDPDGVRSPAPNVMAPGVCLIGVGILGVLANLLRIVLALAAPDLVQQAIAANPLFQGMKAADAQSMLLVPGALFLAVSLATLAGGIAMLRRQTYWLAVVGSVTAMVNLNDCCCLLGIPVGIWAMIVLFNPDVKASFR